MKKLSSYQKYVYRLKDRKLSRLIENIEISVNMALLQSERILADNAAFELPQASSGTDPILFLELFADIHFYLVSVDNIRKSLDRLDETLNGKLEEIQNDYRDFFYSANAVRCCQEHLDERIKSGKYYGEALDDNWVYEICGKTVVIGPPAANKLVKLYRTLDAKLESFFPTKGEKD